MIPKKKYRDKVRERLAVVQNLFSDTERVEEMMRRVGIFEKGSDFHNKMEAVKMLLGTDVPALLDALDQIALTKQNNENI